MFIVARCTCFNFGFLLIILSNFSESINSQNFTAPPNNAPIEFPKNESQYPFVQNSTILEALTSQTSNDTEVDDLLHGGRNANISHSVPKSVEIPRDVTNSTLDHNRKMDSELIEDGSDTEDAKFNNSLPIKSRTRDSYGAKMPVVQGQLAAILAGVLILIAVLGYVGLLSWRRFLESRYGNREMLVNEEDFYDPNDMRHFSL